MNPSDNSEVQSFLSNNFSVPVQASMPPWTNAGPRSLDRKNVPTHPITVYHSTYSPPGRVKGRKLEVEMEKEKGWNFSSKKVAPGPQDSSWCALVLDTRGTGLTDEGN